MFIPVLGVPIPWANLEKALIDPAEDHAERRSSRSREGRVAFLQRIVYQYCSAEHCKLGLTNQFASWSPMPNTSDNGDYIEERNREKRRLVSTIEIIPTFWHEAYRDAPLRIFAIRNAVRRELDQ